MVEEIPFSESQSMRSRYIFGAMYFGGYLVVLAGLFWGWLKGFPRWVFSYLAYGIVFALYLANASTPGLVIFNIPMWGRELWGWRACVPMAMVALSALLLSRPP